MRDIQLFLQEYDLAVISGDIERIANNFHSQFTLSTSAELWHLNNDDAFISNLAKTFNKYNKLGAKACKMLSTDIINLKSDHYMVNVKWGLINAEKLPFIEFDITYFIKRIDNTWKFIFVIDHNEP